MALSEQERKLLEQLEASLKADDPHFAEALSGRGQVQLHRRRATLAGLGFLAGLAALFGGVQLHPAVSIAGFVLMLVAAIIGIGAWQRVQDDGEPARGGSSAPKGGGGRAAGGSSSEDFMERLEERWKKRQQGEQP